MRSLILVFLSALIWSAPVGAAPVAVTTSGGVSLGAYQAGFLYYTYEWFKQNRSFQPQVVTGASAGGINAFLGVLSLCDSVQPDPAGSLFWKTWMDLNLRDLVNPKTTSPIALFAAEAFDRPIALVKQRWDQGLPESCDITMGISVTRQSPARLRFNSGFEFDRQEEKFSIRIRGQGPGRPPRLDNVVDPAQQMNQPILALTGNAYEDFIILKNLLLASSAFPTAFPPQKIPHCWLSAQQLKQNESPRCQPSAIMIDNFVDGGTFDNKPLRLAYRLSASRSPRSTESSWIYLYVDLAEKRYPDDPFQNNSDVDTRLLSNLGSTLQNFISSSRGKDISQLIDERPGISQQVSSSSSSYPRASDHLLAFFGFLERDLRIFDFYLGMFEARKFLSEEMVHKHPPGRMYLPNANSPQLSCLRGYLNDENNLRSSCQDLGNFRILLQVTLDRLYSNCAKLSKDDIGGFKSHQHCMRAQQGHPPPRLVEPDTGQAIANDFWRRRSDESDFLFTIRLLDTYRFEFRDLGLSRDETRLAPTKIKTGFLEAMNRLAAAQPLGDRVVLQATAQPIVNFYEYVPSERLLYALVGNSWEFGSSSIVQALRYPYFRFNFALQMQNYLTLLTNDRDLIASTPLLGVEWEPASLTGPAAQLRFGVRLGYQISSERGFTNAGCPALAPSRLHCTGWVLQPTISFTILERLRLQFSYEWLNVPDQPNFTTSASFINAGIQLPF